MNRIPPPSNEAAREKRAARMELPSPVHPEPWRHVCISHFLPFSPLLSNHSVILVLSGFLSTHSQISHRFLPYARSFVLYDCDVILYFHVGPLSLRTWRHHYILWHFLLINHPPVLEQWPRFQHPFPFVFFHIKGFNNPHFDVTMASYVTFDLVEWRHACM